MTARCDFYGVCEVDTQGSTRCVCPAKQTCPKGNVCASDGLTKDECRMKEMSCAKKIKIEAVHKGQCGKHGCHHSNLDEILDSSKFQT